MRILKYSIWIFFGLGIFLLGCGDVLEAEEQDAIDGDRVFNDADLSELYLNDIYQRVLPGYSGLANVDLSGESLGGGELMAGQYLDPVEGTQDAYGPYSINTFAVIRNINVFLEGVENGSIEGNARERLMGQAYFLRAWRYWELVLYYGGVPLVLEPLDINEGEANQLPRASAAACVEQIVSDLDNAIDMIGEYGDIDYGRVTRAAAAALKGRVLLFFASPQFDPDGTNSADGIPERWEAAYEANLEAKQIAEASGHGLFADFSRIFLEEDNQEAIFIRKYTLGLATHGYENSVRPGSAKSSGGPGGVPNWDLVEAFPMADGTPVTESPDYDPEVYWKDRDPRFYATITYNSAQWQFIDREAERQWIYEGNNQENINPVTGFYLRKNVDTTLTSTETNRTPTDWIEIRFAEVMLNLAEAANETNKQDEAYQELYAIRERAGIASGGGSYGLPSGLSKAELRAVIMNERRIELAYENKRYWDLRRRNLYINGVDGTAEGRLNGTRRRAAVTTVDTDYIINTLEPSIAGASDPQDSARHFFEAHVRDTVDWDNPENYDVYFNTVIEDAESLDINYLQPKYNFFFLPPNAIGLNPNLEQTVRWADGTFDPLAE